MHSFSIVIMHFKEYNRKRIEYRSERRYAMAPIAAFVYDFDRTLSPKDMQEYTFIPDVGLSTEEFWKNCDRIAKENKMDPILAYMLYMVKSAKGKLELKKETFQNQGKSVEFFPGVLTWFDRMTKYGESIGLEIEHYIVSSGLREIIEGTQIADCFHEIYAGGFCYDEEGKACWPAMAVNYTSKTQFLYRINKGILDVNDNSKINEYMPDSMRRVPFSNMIYFGDGITDVPSMKVVRSHGGHSIAVYNKDRITAENLLRHERVDYIAPADYSVGSKVEEISIVLLDQIAASAKAAMLHNRDAGLIENNGGMNK